VVRRVDDRVSWAMSPAVAAQATVKAMSTRFIAVSLFSGYTVSTFFHCRRGPTPGGYER
jgi:hypothetical protein